MTNRPPIFTMAIVATLLLSTTAAQAAGYFIRPALRYSSEFVDGYQPNGPTQGSQTFSDGFQSLEAHVDLGEGTVKTLLSINGPNPNFAIATGVFGERIRFTGATGTTVNFSFDFDGTIEATQDVIDNGIPDDRYIGIQAYFAVYDASVGATYTNWTNFGTISDQALLVNYVPLEFNDLGSDFTEIVLNSDLGGSLNLVSGRSYDVFAAFNLLVKQGINPGLTTMNFLNTGRIGISDSNFTSSSGQFLGFAQTAAAVPEPSQWAMLVIGFGIVGGIARRRPAPLAA